MTSTPNSLPTHSDLVRDFPEAESLLIEIDRVDQLASRFLTQWLGEPPIDNRFGWSEERASDAARSTSRGGWELAEARLKVLRAECVTRGYPTN